MNALEIWLREFADICGGMKPVGQWPGEGASAKLREAAAALEAAREDGERWRQAFVDERASRYRAGGMKIEQARIHAEKDAEVAAIDQARGKGVAGA